jgi:hypothetical protein
MLVSRGRWRSMMAMAKRERGVGGEKGDPEGGFEASQPSSSARSGKRSLQEVVQRMAISRGLPRLLSLGHMRNSFLASFSELKLEVCAGLCPTGATLGALRHQCWKDGLAGTQRRVGCCVCPSRSAWRGGTLGSRLESGSACTSHGPACGWAAERVFLQCGPLPGAPAAPRGRRTGHARCPPHGALLQVRAYKGAGGLAGEESGSLSRVRAACRGSQGGAA